MEVYEKADADGGYVAADEKKKKMLKRIPKLEEGQVSGGQDWRIEGQKVRVTRKSSKGFKRKFMTSFSWRKEECGILWS